MEKNNIDIANETNQFFVANSAGDYKVLTTSNGGCTSLSSKVSVVVNCREGDFAKSEFEIFPNPSNDFIYITGSIIEKSGVISIYDLAGRMVKSYISIGSNNNLEVEISSLEDGLYVISYESGNSEKAFSRFIKED
ncbi:MAG: T9SS type A sorting domain-containing protein [Bacteroidetes bacterium]|nr:T9SS type A sorting domain-containing protein [Bacteroidota bacterium]